MEESKDSTEESTASSTTIKTVKTAPSKSATKKETTAKDTPASGNKVSQETTDSDKGNKAEEGQRRRRRSDSKVNFVL